MWWWNELCCCHCNCCYHKCSLAITEVITEVIKGRVIGHSSQSNAEKDYGQEKTRAEWYIILLRSMIVVNCLNMVSTGGTGSKPVLIYVT